MIENRTAIHGKVEDMPDNMIRFARVWLTDRLGYPPTHAFINRVAEEIVRYGSVIVIIPREDKKHD